VRLHVCAVGRLRAKPERKRIDEYLARAGRTGRAVGLGQFELHEIEDRKGAGRLAEAALLRRKIPDKAKVVALDERGTALTSPEFARLLGDWRDTGVRDVAFLIGGANGLEPGLRGSAHMRLAFGSMVWPHTLARLMLAEQLYRAASILAGTPYHRA